MKNWKKNLPEGFESKAAMMSEEDLKSMILESTEYVKRTKAEREEDVNFQHAREVYQDLAGAYRDTINAYTAKIMLAVEILEERGVSLLATTADRAAS